MIKVKHIMQNILFKSTVLLIFLSCLTACSQNDRKKNTRESFGLSNQKDQYLQDIQFISKKPRTPGSSHHRSVQKMCAQRLDELGFQVELQNYGSGVNVIGISPGKLNPTEKILVSAHYDTVPQCNGADDNASGIAGVFETARLLVTKKHKRTLVIACWDEEESKTIGAKEYVAQEKSNNSDIKMSFVYEMIAYKSDEAMSQQIPAGFDVLFAKQVDKIKNNQNRGDFILLVYDEDAQGMLTSISEHAESQMLPLIQIEVSANLKKSISLADLRRSDHAPFWDADYPAMMITDTANFRNENYHCLNGEDNIESLDIDFALKTVNVISKIISETLNK